MTVRYIAKFWAYYTRKLSIFLVVKWRSSDSTCTLSAIIYGWECRDQVRTATKPLDVLGTFTVRPWQRPCWGRLDSHGCLRRDLSVAIGTPPTDNMAAKFDTEWNVTCLVAQPSTHRVRVLHLLPVAPSARILAFLGTARADDYFWSLCLCISCE